MFENVEIPLDELPRVAELEWQPLDPGYRTRLIVERLITSAFLLAGATAISIVRPAELRVVPAFLFATIAIAAIGMLAWPFIALPRMGYVIRDKDIVFRKGVFWRSVTAIPFNRIQHVETSSTPLDRRFNLASLKVFTAGGSSGDLKIDGLGADRAEQLRALVLEKAGASIESD